MEDVHILLAAAAPGRDTSCSGRSAGPVSHMKFSACVFWSLLAAAAMPVCEGEMYTSLLNVKQAITVERRLIDHLRTYIDRELERLDDIRRWVARHAGKPFIERSSVGICLTEVRQFVVLKEFAREGAKFLITGAEILSMNGLCRC